jgi:hypothetical protein
MTTMPGQQISGPAQIAAATVVATIAVAACSSAPAVGQGSSCEVNPATAPVPTAEPYEPVPEVGRIAVALSGITSGAVKPGAAPTEVDVTLCNNSAVAYPEVGVVLALERCTCATTPIGIPRGTVERFDSATNGWIQLEHPAMGTGMDYLVTYTNEQELPKGKAVTLRYRITLGSSMTDGAGGVQAVAVTPDPLVQIGRADLPFTVSKGSATPPTVPTPASRQTVLPLTGLTYPFDLAVNSGGHVYVTDTRNNRVVKLPTGSNDQTVLPFTNGVVDVAVDSADSVYVVDAEHNRVLKLAAGSNTRPSCRSPGSIAP